MHLPDWRERPAQTYFGPASWQARVLAVAAAIFLRTSIAALTLIGLVVNRFWPAAMQRARLDLIDQPLRYIRALPGTEVTPLRLTDCPAEWVVAPGARDSDRAIVYFHGSALVTLGLNSHRRFASKLSEATGAKVFNVGYRLAPLAGIDEAVADGLCAYRHVLEAGFTADRIVVAGDSAGGLMAVNTALAARDAGLPAPAGQVLMSPLTSADMEIKRQAARTHRDPFFPFMAFMFIYRVFATVNGTRELPVMPPEAELRGLGPFLLQVGNDEMLRNDAFVLADKLTAAGVPNWVQIWDRALHMFQLSFDVNPDARRAVEEIADFVGYLTGCEQPGPRWADPESA
ncbi:alpha/beta hydrolase [Mycolicibacter hiberniae]|uniref:Putative lipase/esterase n=1 Tax=Mycolicibacter hiberniae TaxID=29314 RepID=A0A7I7X167_9MYCO|nr:alpha/beta hydrolase [Mycolicibacter hiberniae]MCV7086416.1 alpha/beta hydrolase [Mycolicibacter hiberniae]ORV70059.1 esterase [Mycolicibacter hiberniae]BBZ21988.1 putative lipase/esterase [Mycolicibacter hiberniae]